LLKRSVDYKNPEDKTKAGKKTDTFKGLADSENSNIKPVRDQVEEVIYGKDGDKGLEGIRQRIFKSKENGEDVTPTKHELNFIYNKAIPTLQSAIKNGMDEDNPDTKKYLEKWISTAHLIDRIDPKRSQNWHNYQKNPKGILDTPARLVLGGIAAGLAITAIVMVISRKLNGKEITGMDMAITAGYTAAAAVALGFWPKGQETQLEQIAQTDMRMRSRPMAPFRGLYKNKTITRDQGMEATQEFHDLLSDMSKNEKNELRSSFENGNVLQQLEELGISKDSNLYTVFKKLQTPQQQGIFANSLLTLDVHDSKKIETIKRSIQYIDIT